MTFAQLRSFATVARTGSVSEAARTLGVSEPAVSAAIAALRRDLGDALFIRAGGGIRLTPGGERLAAAAAEIIGLQERLRREVSEARGERGLLRLAVSPTVAEYASAPLLDAFTRRWATLEVAQEVAAPEDFAALLADRRADVALGPAPAPASGIDGVAFLRYKLVVVARPRHAVAAPARRPPGCSARRALARRADRRRARPLLLRERDRARRSRVRSRPRPLRRPRRPPGRA